MLKDIKCLCDVRYDYIPNCGDWELDDDAKSYEDDGLKKLLFEMKENIAKIESILLIKK